jgi:uncharacterized protein (TIGR00661 family)
VEKKINNTYNSKRILIAPLDWGLGHTTRLIPIIRFLIATGSVPIIASNIAAKTLLQKEFPSLNYIDLPGYDIAYSKKGNWLVFKLLAQAPRVWRQFFLEHQWLKKAVIVHKIDGIISDNRPSFYHKKIPSVYITHQLQIFSTSKIVQNFARKMHYQFINKYQACWVPDFEGVDNLAGDLSHPEQLPKTDVKYIGPLSRFSSNSTKAKENLVALISGPEPQRSMLEAILIAVLKRFDQPAILVIGNPGKEKLKFKDGKLTVYNHLDATELEEHLQSARIIIARAGYSTVMDLLYLQKNAILIPTPGQSEQEYLAEYLGSKSNFVFVKQEESEIMQALNNFEERTVSHNYPAHPCFEETVSDFVNSL